MSTSSDIVAIVVNYNSGSILRSCLQALLHSSEPMRIVVVDNASTDNSISSVASLIGNGDHIKVVVNNTNIGFSRANNQILRNESACYYVLVNPDCIVEQDTISIVKDEIERDSKIGIASCFIRNQDGSIQRTCRRRFPTPWSAITRMLGLSKWMQGSAKFRDFDYGADTKPDQTEYVDAISGAFMVVRGKALQEVGLLDPGYFLHCEDLDWCKRFSEHGYKVGFVPYTQVMHQKGVSGGGLAVNWHLHRGMLRFYRTYYMNRYSKLLFPIVCLGVGLSFLARAGVILARRLRFPGPKNVAPV